ncbi:MAG: transposase [Acidobacteria bacterium]|nr:transposase [Acidobacteriota bacterium]
MLKDRLSLLFHIIFSTKNQEHLIDEKVAPLLYSCIEGVLWEPYYSPALITGGGSDHVHIFLGLSRIVTPDLLICGVKERSAIFMRSLGEKYAGFEWQEGYAAFTISRWETDDLKAYIANQRAFHKTTSFQDEYRSILTENSIEYDENALWD